QAENRGTGSPCPAARWRLTEPNHVRRSHEEAGAASVDPPNAEPAVPGPQGSGPAVSGPESGVRQPGIPDQPATPEPAPAGRSSAAKIVGRVVAIGITGLALYVVLPSLTRVIAEWPQLSKLSPVWLIGSLLAEAASFTCAYALQRLVLRTKKWLAVVAAGLAGNAVTNVLPAGAAAGAAAHHPIPATAAID